MKTEVQPYYRNGKLVKGYFREGKPELVKPDELMCNHYQRKEDGFI